MHIVGLAIGVLILAVSLLFLSNLNLFVFLIGLALSIILLPFVIDITLTSKRNVEINEMFLEFSRNLSESVKTGTPISKSIFNLKGRKYGSLSPYVEKLANQISIGIPVNKALETFADEVDNTVISRAVTLIREAEKAGGEIDSILESSARSIAEIEKLRKERKAAISTLVVQGYLIFFIFIGIMLIMEFNILPLTSDLQGVSMDITKIDVNTMAKAGVPDNTATAPPEKGVSPFFLLLLVQGLFAGLIIGKLTEGSIKSGIIHSFILLLSAFLISTGAKLIFK